MKRLIHIALGVAFVVTGSVFATFTSAIAAPAAAIVTYVEGTAQVYAQGVQEGPRLRKNDRVAKDKEVRVGERSRLELRFPDGTIMRFAERSVVKMDELSFDTKTGNKNLRVNIGVGKLWASVKKLFSPDSKVEVKTVNAVAGVRGTVYRVNVNDDNSALVKVYDGSVYVDGVQKSTAPAAPSGGFTAPVPVPGPHEVPPPYHEVTMEEWHIIVKSFQQITISPQGAASQPQDFNPQQDMDDWVRWNLERDRQLTL